MHATYCFLSNSDDPLSEFELLADNEYVFDENNWYQPMCIVNSHGVITKLCPDGDWRGRSKFANKFKYAPKIRRWKDAIKFAEGCFMYDIQEAIVAGDYSITKRIEKTVTFDNAKSEIRFALSTRAYCLDSYRIKTLAEVLSHLEWSKNHFCSDFPNPYSGPRAIAMNDADLFDENASILFVDIHT